MSLALTINIVLLWILLIFNILLSLALVKKTNELGIDDYRYRTLEKGESVPEFKALDLKGESITLNHFKGRSVAFVFSSISCKPCLEKIPKLGELKGKAKKAGVDLVIVSLDKFEEAESFAIENDISLPVLVAPYESNSFKKDYKVAGTPFFLLIDKEHQVLAADFLNEEWDEIVASW